tara:strand:+ start:357 stop:671 length:315 start_codon:yes stop_codon:yes gene_type:complete
MGKIKKYIIGFFTLLGGILIAFLTGKSAGRKDEKFKGIKSESKKINKRIKKRKSEMKAVEKSLKNKKEALKEMKTAKEKGYKKKEVGAKEASKYLKSYLNKREK